MQIQSRTARPTTSVSRSKTTLCHVYLQSSFLQDADLNLYPVSFLCPNGTVFNQEIFVCDWWSVQQTSSSISLLLRNYESFLKKHLHTMSIKLCSGLMWIVTQLPVSTEQQRVPLAALEVTKILKK